VLALIGSFFLGLRLGGTLGNLIFVNLVARRMDSGQSIAGHTMVGMEWGSGGSTIVGSGSAEGSQLEIVKKSAPGKGRGWKDDSVASKSVSVLFS
jgi:hypothetical protein